MTCILLCHFPDGAGCGIMTRKRRCGIKDSMSLINALCHWDGPIMPTRHCRRSYYDKAKYMPSKRAPRLHRRAG
jgi:hypothetical protein